MCDNPIQAFANTFARVAGAVVTGGLSEAMPNDPLVGRKKGLIPSTTGKVLTLGMSQEEEDELKVLSKVGGAPLTAVQAERKAQLEARRAQMQQRQAVAAYQGRGSTILTGGKLGDLGEGSGRAKTILGG